MSRFIYYNTIYQHNYIEEEKESNNMLEVSHRLEIRPIHNI